MIIFKSVKSLVEFLLGITNINLKKTEVKSSSTSPNLFLKAFNIKPPPAPREYQDLLQRKGILSSEVSYPIQPYSILKSKPIPCMEQGKVGYNGKRDICYTHEQTTLLGKT